MYKSLRNSLRIWNETHGERAKMQHAYLAIAVITILTAGLLGLLDYDLGQQLTAIAMVALGMFFINLVVWTLLSGTLLASLEQTTPAARARAKSKK